MDVHTMDALLCEELDIPKHHIKETSIENRYILVVDKSWLKYIKQEKKLCPFPVYKGYHNRKVLPELCHPWTKVYIQIYRKKANCKVIPLPKTHGETFVTKLPEQYSDVLHNISNINYKNLWRNCYQKYPGAHIKYAKGCCNNNNIGNSNIGGNRSGNIIKKQSDYTHHDYLLRKLIRKIFNCTIIKAKIKSPTLEDNNIGTTVKIDEDDSHSNIMPSLIAIETNSFITVIFYPPAIESSLYDCVTYSPAILQKSFNKPLFIFYQVFELTKYLHQNNLLLGDLHLNDIYMSDNLWLKILPKIESNLIEINVDDVITPQQAACNDIGSTNNQQNAIDDLSQKESIRFDLKFAYNLQQFSLREYCEMWTLGQLSNFDYLTILNNAVGRKIGLPGYHHIMPWVTDFANRNGTNWRDLTKSKYRINKGDAHLDLMFTQLSSSINGVGVNKESCSNEENHSNCGVSTNVPHHVSDFLSEITYFVYMARRTSQSVLCQHVRPIWVPAEYPVSIQRLQEWTPDECIPEFYSDPMVFKSIHEDLPDLELPAWATCPEDFIVKHREALESQYVSERLNFWIDLNFGYKLSGKAAIKSKNVCLSLVDNHKNLQQRGIVQLFNHAHPPKRFPSQWFEENAPRISNSLNLQKRQLLARSSEDLSGIESALHSTSIHDHRQMSERNRDKDVAKRRSGSTQRLPSSNSIHLGSTNSLAEDQTYGLERSMSFYETELNATNNIIYLPKYYKPLELLNNLENIENFFAKTFLDVKGDILSPLNEKLQQNDMLFDMESSNNSFTNKFFSESFEMNQSVISKKAMSKNFIIPNQVSRDSKEIFDEKMHKDFQVIGCLMVELFLINKIRPMTMNCTSLSFKKRLNTCQRVAKKYLSDIPKCFQYAVKLFLNLNEGNVIDNIDRGLPFPTAETILEPVLSNSLIAFPFEYFRIYHGLKNIHQLDRALQLLDLYTHFSCDGKCCDRFYNLDKKRIVFQRKIAECKVASFCKQIFGLLEPISYEQFASFEILLPFTIELLRSDDTAIQTAWDLFDSISSSLGVKDSQKYLLKPILKLYDIQGVDLSNRNFGIDSSHMKFKTSSSFKNRKAVKLYHHIFLLRLIVRFGLKCFLDNFITYLIEAVGGYKEPIETCGYHFHSYQENEIKNVNLKLSYNDDESAENSLTLMSPDTMKSDPTISVCEDLPSANSTKVEGDDIFAFDSEIVDTTENMKRIRNNSENLSIDSFEMPLKAEEATEDLPYLGEKFSINDIIVNNSFDDDKTSDNNSQKDSPQILNFIGPTSPTIPIPTAYRRTYELNTIDCEIGSRKSVDSFDFGTTLIELKAESVKKKSNQSKEIDDEPNTCSNNMIRSERTYSHDNKISKMGKDSLIWLTHRLGPVLTARYITRNLLRMLTLCYVGQENLLPENYEIEENGNLNYFSIADSKVVGDRNAAGILECLTAVSDLYGEEFILLQYLPHVSELVALGQKKITPSLEGALISSLQLLKFIMPCLNDSTLMEHLQDIILKNINPIIMILSTTKMIMPSGFLGRSVLARKLLDTIYVICVRIGPEMTKEKLCTQVLQQFFLIFDKGMSENFIELMQKTVTISDKNEVDDNEFQVYQKAMEEIHDVFNPSLAHCSYLMFLRFLGESIMTKAIINLNFILTLCHEFEQPEYSSISRSKHRRNSAINSTVADNDLSDEYKSIESHSFGTSVIGNRIEVVHSAPKQKIGPMELLDLVAYKVEQVNLTRQLRGNWLAYWRHEISRPEKDTQLYIKQIKLQTFAGHTNSVRAILCLDNENSFMSASKDKTVKLWSLRSEGDGKKVKSCQFTYNCHKKSVHSLAFSDTLRLVASCDSGVHLWDPFIGRPIGILDTQKHSPVSIIRTFPSPSPLLIAGTAESTVKIIDCRIMEYVNEYRVANNQNSTVRCLACSPSGHWIAIGLSSGTITVLDSRTGIIMRSWKATDGELLQLVALNDQQIISSSLDFNITVWNITDNTLQYSLKQPQEPAHCLYTIDSDLIFATPANRIGVYTNLNTNNGSCSITKLRSETIKGILTSFAVLPLNRMVLTGNDSGNIVLLC